MSCRTVGFICLRASRVRICKYNTQKSLVQAGIRGTLARGIATESKKSDAVDAAKEKLKNAKESVKRWVKPDKDAEEGLVGGQFAREDQNMPKSGYEEHEGDVKLERQKYQHRLEEAALSGAEKQKAQSRHRKEEQEQAIKNWADSHDLKSKEGERKAWPAYERWGEDISKTGQFRPEDSKKQ